MRVVFMGTTDFSLEALKALHEHAFDIVCVYTKMPKPKGRGAKLEKTIVHEYALENKLTVETPKTLRTDEAFEKLKSYAPDVIVVAAYGLILPSNVLNLPKYGCINIHGSYLPRWRGAAPIERALLAGDTKTGITIIQMDEGIDTGDILAQKELDIASDEDFASLFDRMKKLGALMIVDVLKNINQAKRAKQPEKGVTYAHKIESPAYILDPLDTMEVNYNKVRAFSKGCKFFYKEDAFFIIHEVRYQSRHHEETSSSRSATRSVENLGSIQRFMDPGSSGLRPQSRDDTLYLPCKDGHLEILKIQKPGKKVLMTKEFLRGLSN